MNTNHQISEQNQKKVIKYLSQFDGKRGLYIIKSKDAKVLETICKKLNKPFLSEIAYVGLGDNYNTSNLYLASRLQMGWSNFRGANFVKKIGNYLGFDTNELYNRENDKTREFICNNFDIECIIIEDNEDLKVAKAKYINKLKPCLNG